MPAGPGETLLTTLFADIHYYFSHPSTTPAHHRFDRGSYIYLFHSPAQQQAKLEVANHAGTPNQDAFHGYLNVARVKHSHLQPNLISIKVDTAAVPDHSTWHLPSYNERNEQKYMYKLHALDLYLWTEKDASTLIAHLKKLLSPDRLDIKNSAGSSSPHAEHRDSMSPVVQQLERTAIGSPFQQRTASTVSAHSIPGPPTPAASGSGSPHVMQAAPMAYNPAAPAAPEPVTYREKTPPPHDASSGTGLGNAARYDSMPPQSSQFTSTPGLYSTSTQTTPQNAYFSGPPQQQQSPASRSSIQGPSCSMPPPPQQQRAPSFGPMAQSTLPQSPPPGQQTFQRASTFGGPPGQTQYASYTPQTNHPSTPGYNPQMPPTPSAPPAYTGHTPMQSPALPPPPPLPHQQQQQQKQHPLGGYSDYNYATAQAYPSSNAQGGYTGDIHNQAYRPTESEHSAHGSKPTRSNTGSGDGKPFGNLEGKVGKYLNKFDKLW